MLSPQFVLWIATLLALVVKGLPGAALVLLTAGLTSAVYPNLDRKPGETADRGLSS